MITARHGSKRFEPVDTDALKRDHPIEGVLSGYGVALRRQGRQLLGRCPFHNDQGKPNLSVNSERSMWYCFVCGEGGDTIGFVRKIEGCGFLDAVRVIEDSGVGVRSYTPSPVPTDVEAKPVVSEPHSQLRAEEVTAALTTAVELYSSELVSRPDVLTYLEGRGISRRTASRNKMGYSTGRDLLWYLRQRGVPYEVAETAGLLTRGRDNRYHERFRGRITVPDYDSGKPVWMIARAYELQGNGTPAYRGGEKVWPDTLDKAECPAKYLGLPGTKPLFGYDAVKAEREVYAVEGPFDMLTLHSWELPAVALCGTGASRGTLERLAGFERVHLVLDSDSAGQQAAEKLLVALGDRAVVHSLPSGFKDVGEMAALEHGKERFLSGDRI